MHASIEQMFSLAGRVAVVTGGAGGIGSAIVALFRAADAQVACVDAAPAAALDGVLRLQRDLSQAADVESAMAAVCDTYGRIDIVVHAVGIARDRTLLRMTDDEWHAVVAANLDSAFYVVRAAGAAMRERGGAMVLISSINGERGKAGQANYAASKAGLNALAKTAARELGRHGVRVNALAPGWIDTAMTQRLPAELHARALDETALGRLGTPENVAAAALFLCADAGRHITGQVIRVDGGQLIA